jgi:hypothetical protein
MQRGESCVNAEKEYFRRFARYDKNQYIKPKEIIWTDEELELKFGR